MKKPISCLALLCVISGCATSTARYTAPQENRIVNTKTSSKPFDILWKSLVKSLSSDFFVINNIDKESNIINVSFSSSRPSDYVDCGSSVRTFKNARGTQTYAYNSADSTTFTFTNDFGDVFHANRVNKLEGRVNIYVGQEGKETNVSVNAKYVLSGSTNFVNVMGAPAGVRNHSFDFSTKQPYADQDLTCRSTGSIEKKILDLVD